MPHLHLSTTADLIENVDVPDILEALVQVFSGLDTVQPSAVKAYHSLHTHWAMGQGAPAGFAHLEVRVLTGRSLELRQQMADALYTELRARFAQSLESGEAHVSLEIREMLSETYRK